MNEKKLFEDLRMIKRLLAVNIMKDFKSLKEQVRVLIDVGFSPIEIADITGKSPNLIRVTKFSLKEKGSKVKENQLKEEEIKDEL